MVDVLVVCTANISRSPVTAALLRHRLDERFGELAAAVAVASAGTDALPGHPIDPVAASLLTDLGVRPPASPARQLDAGLVADADVVLTMTREQRAFVVDLVPAAQRSTFTLLELARTATAWGGAVPRGDLGTAWRVLLSSAPAWRGPSAPADPAADDVADVHRRPREVQAATVRRISTAVDALLSVLVVGEVGTEVSGRRGQRSTRTRSSSSEPLEGSGW